MNQSLDNGFEYFFFILLLSDYDECNPALINHVPDCGSNANCVNRNMTYDCVCKDEFVSSGPDCVRKHSLFLRITQLM